MRACSDSIWYTLIGLKFLKQNFSEDTPKYRYVEKKARNVLRVKLGFEGDVDGVIANIEIQFEPVDDRGRKLTFDD